MAETTAPQELIRLNTAPTEAFCDALGVMVEHSPWVARSVAGQRPFASVWSLHAAMLAGIRQAPSERQRELMRLHPELAGREAADGTMTEASNAEQTRLGLLALGRAELANLNRLNAEYRERFGVPFIVALRLHRDFASVVSSLEQRLGRETSIEHEENLRQIGEVLRGRLARHFGTPLGWLSTHVLDSHGGTPAAGVGVEIARFEGEGEAVNGGWLSLGRAVTNADGRTDLPMLVDRAMTRGVFELRFDAGDYFRRQGVALADPPFLDRIPIRFGIDDADLHYHVPLLCTPWTYSTYRGS